MSAPESVSFGMCVNKMEMPLPSELAIGSAVPLHKLVNLKSFRGLRGEENTQVLKVRLKKKKI